MLCYSLSNNSNNVSLIAARLATFVTIGLYCERNTFVEDVGLFYILAYYACRPEKDML